MHCSLLLLCTCYCCCLQDPEVLQKALWDGLGYTPPKPVIINPINPTQVPAFNIPFVTRGDTL